MRHLVTILDSDFEVEFDFEITVRGRAATPPSLIYPGDPPEGPEFEITEVALLDSRGAVLEIPKWLEELLREYLYEDDAVFEKICEADTAGDGGYDEP